MWAANPFYRWPRWATMLTLALLIPGIWLATQLPIRSTAETLLQDDERNRAAYEKVASILDDGVVIVVNMRLKSIFTTQGLTQIRQVSNALEDLDWALEVKSLTHATRPVRQGLTFTMEPLINEIPTDPQALRALEHYCQNNPLIRNIMISPNGRDTLLLLYAEGQFPALEDKRRLKRDLEATLLPFEQAGVAFFTIGLPLIEEEMLTDLKGDLVRFLPAAAIFGFGALAVLLRSGWLILAVAYNQALAAVALPAVFVATGADLTLVTFLLFPLLGGVHLTLLIHILSALRRAVSATSATPVRDATQEIFRSSLFASLTTALGLLSLTLSPLPSIREFGALGALGTAVVFLLAFGPNIAWLRWIESRLSFRPPSAKAGAGVASIALAERVHRLSLPQWALLAAVFTALVFAGAHRIRAGTRPTELLDPSSPTRQALESMNTLYGGINIAQIEMDTGVPNGVTRTEALTFLDRLHTFAEDQDEVSAVYSLSSLLGLMNQIWEGDLEAPAQMPSAPWTRNLFFLALRSVELPFLASLVDTSFQQFYLIVRTPDMPSSQYLETLDRVSAFAQSNAPAGVQVSARSSMAAILEADRQIVRSQSRSAAALIVSLSLCLFGLWRCWRLVGIALLVNLIPLAALAGIAGAIGAPLNTITVLVAGLTMGIAIDDAVHFITFWSESRRAGRSKAEATRYALQVKGPPILGTSALLSTLLASFLFASFPPARQFGLLASLGIVMAWGSTVLLTPTLLHRWGPTPKLPAA